MNEEYLAEEEPSTNKEHLTIRIKITMTLMYIEAITISICRIKNFRSCIVGSYLNKALKTDSLSSSYQKN